MSCQCGHERDEHQDAVMSVPLTPKPSPYWAPTVLYNNICRFNPNATYDQQQCHCGCCQFDELN